MSSSPYRTPAPPPNVEISSVPACPDADLLPVFAVLWLATIARLAIGLSGPEPFGSELTLATLIFFGLPLLSLRAIIWKLRQIR